MKVLSKETGTTRKKRSRKSARNAGTAHETRMAKFFKAYLSPDVARRSKNGSQDRGDIDGVKYLGQRIVIECKDLGGKTELGSWINEAETERLNDKAGVAIVAAKRRGKDYAGDQWIIMTATDLVSLMRGFRPDRQSFEAIESEIELSDHGTENTSPEIGNVSFADYQKQTAKTAIYPEAGNRMPVGLAYTSLGLTSEAGEVAGKYKKVIRDSDGLLDDDARENMLAELGDVLWYASQIATELGADLGEVAQANLEKLFGRKERGTLKGSGDKR